MKKTNPQGNWKQAKEIAKQLAVRAKVAQDLEVDRAKNYQAMKDLTLELYKSLPAYDALYTDSPLSPLRLRFALNAFSKRIGMEGVKNIFVSPLDIKDFTHVVDEAIAWALKFEKENEKAT